MTSARRTRRRSSFYKWLTRGRPPKRPDSEVPAAVVVVAVAVAVHYQGFRTSRRRQSQLHRMTKTTIVIGGPDRTVVRTNPWTRTWGVWRAHRANRKLIRTLHPGHMMIPR